MNNKNIGVYIHTPFCRSKCPYCDFYSIPYESDIADRYVDALINEINSADEFTADTLFFGGGTPSLLGANRLNRILNALSGKLTDNCEITLECNPKTVDFGILKDYYTIGINRLSIGVQSFNDNELKALGRIHSSYDAKNIVSEAQSAGFKNISIDLMIATPEQTLSSLRKSLKTATELSVPHISCYMLTIEPNTPFAKKEFKADDMEIAEFYLATVNDLKYHGILQYEISNFAKQGFESKHNLKYWNSEYYLGFGASAHSYYNGKRYCHERDINEYIKSNGSIIRVTDSNPGDFSEYAMLRLRLVEGLSLDFAKDNFGVDTYKLIEKARPFEKLGLIRITDGVIAFTPKGFLVSNELIAKLVL